VVGADKSVGGTVRVGWTFGTRETELLKEAGMEEIEELEELREEVEELVGAWVALVVGEGENVGVVWWVVCVVDEVVGGGCGLLVLGVVFEVVDGPSSVLWDGVGEEKDAVGTPRVTSCREASEPAAAGRARTSGRIERQRRSMYRFEMRVGVRKNDLIAGAARIAAEDVRLAVAGG